MSSPRQGNPSSIIIHNLVQDFSLPDGSTIRVLDGLDLVLPLGRSIAIVGASGSGKSTLLALLAGLERPTAGSVTMLGHELGRMTEEALSAFRGRHIGFMFQNFQLLGHFDALMNVTLAAQLSGLSRPKERAREALEQVGLGHRLHHHPTRLSGGECQRVALARALVKNPEILLCDEPTGNLDPETARNIFDLMLGTQVTHGSTVILVTHDRELAARCDVKVGLRRGKVDGAAPSGQP